MSKIAVVYWSGTGNTKEMADLVAEGIVSAGKEAEVVDVADASLDALKTADAFAMGCPSMGDEVLEEDVMEPFVTAVEAFAEGKKIALFGSYGWGNGEWMDDWVVRMKAAGAEVVNDAGVIVMEAPDDEGKENCIALGKALAS